MVVRQVVAFDSNRGIPVCGAVFDQNMLSFRLSKLAIEHWLKFLDLCRLEEQRLELCFGLNV